MEKFIDDKDTFYCFECYKRFFRYKRYYKEEH